MSAQVRGLSYESRDYRQDLTDRGQILWEVGSDPAFETTTAELEEVHRRWREAGLTGETDE